MVIVSFAMETKVVPTKLLDENSKCPSVLERRLNERMMSSEDWIERHGSGTLRKNKRIGFAWNKQYLHERVAYEFGYAFEMLPKTRVTFNDAITEGDCHSITEAGWHIERYMTLSIFPEDVFEVKYIMTEEPNGIRREGVGVIVKETSFVCPQGNLIFAILAEFCHLTKEFLPAKVI